MNGWSTIREFPFDAPTEAGLVICAGGFEERAVRFALLLKKSRCQIESSLLLRYEGQLSGNEPNYEILKTQMQSLSEEAVETVPADPNRPIESYNRIRAKIEKLSSQVKNRSAIVDISGMTHLSAIGTIHACITNGFRVLVVYTEAKSYYPPKEKEIEVVRAWKDRKYQLAARYLQSAGLKAVQILPEFVGNFRPGRQTCLMIFVGYEPNRMEGLVDAYAPGALIVFYGKSPHKKLWWRTRLSKCLHEDLFARWHVREAEISTLDIEKIIVTLEQECSVIQEQYDIALAPQCSKMQGLAAYLFWRRHPEVQLIFTSPVSFNPKHYSHGAGRTFLFEIS